MLKMNMQSCLITGEGTTLKEFGTDPISRRIAVLRFPPPPHFHILLYDNLSIGYLTTI